MNCSLARAARVRAELLVELALALCDTPPPAAAAADAAAAVPPAHVGGFLTAARRAAPEAQSAIGRPL